MIISTLIAVILLWKISSVQCHHSSRPCTTTEINVLTELHGKRVLFFFIPGNTTQQLATEGAKIHSWFIKWPAQLNIHLVDQKSLLTFRTSDSLQSWTLTEDGQLLPIGSDQVNPNVVIDPQVLASWQTNSDKLHQEVAELLRLIEAIKPMQISTIELLADSTCVLKLEEKQLLLNVQAWQIGLQRWDVLEKNFEWNKVPEPIVEVDLRYELPVLRNTATLPRHN